MLAFKRMFGLYCVADVIMPIGKLTCRVIIDSVCLYDHYILRTFWVGNGKKYKTILMCFTIVRRKSLTEMGGDPNNRSRDLILRKWTPDPFGSHIKPSNLQTESLGS